MTSINVLGVPHAYDLTAATASPSVLVFIHGWLLSRRYWQPLIERLSPDYQCLSYDLRGFGESQCSSSYHQRGLSSATAELMDSAIAPPKASRYTPAAYAQDLAVLLKQLNITNAWLVGHSLGGSIALWAGQQLPEAVKGVICLNAGGGIYLKEEFERFRSAGAKILRFRPRWFAQLPLIDLLFSRATVARPIERVWGRQRVIDFVMANPQAALGALLDSTTEEEVHHLPHVVSRLPQPVYFMAGAEDTVMEPKYVRHLASFHPTFRACGDNVIEISNCGHMAMVEQPDTVVTQLRAIVARHEVQEQVTPR
ncbi:MULTISPECIES: alpha/beta fold hydrolase [Trichocoleus]|uniref:Alpha/beta hydrolase n=1 Tax=Trichocoleus desertorum GB2-A4 TaxID=2933944 RepID=A0ABV0J603_9CYAN|nr:alpha/beta hydrolase [Trichocoleus sp. FACHB-46]MBD1863323.1 alpha/beta hydrolase [Trichocoleus sp. FACHB-46]